MQAPKPSSGTGAEAARDPAASPRVRLDKWLWAARFFKTRALATEAVQRGRVQVAGVAAKPSREVRIGDLVAMAEPGWPAREVQVLALSAVRGPAPQAQRLYAETPASLAARDAARAARRLAPEPAAALEHGRPTKRDRRRLDSVVPWRRWSASVEDAEP
jgi:ribosome-associated heat shock protein Hsp15